jgi:hypothetical protein
VTAVGARGWVALAAALAPGLVTAPPAQAAAIRLDSPCYLASQPGWPEGERVHVRGEGFAANRPDIEVSIGGNVIGVTSSDELGRIAVGFDSPRVPGGGREGTFPLSFSDGSNTVTAPLHLSRFGADFVPSHGDPARTRFRISVFGFGPVFAAQRRSTRQPIYEHVLDPSGRLVATVRIGRTSGPCGALATRGRRLIPGRTRRGTWRLVLDASRRYRRFTLPRATIPVVVRRVSG